MDFKVGDIITIKDDNIWKHVICRYELHGCSRIGKIQSCLSFPVVDIVIEDKLISMHIHHLEKINDIDETEADKFDAYVELKDLEFKIDYTLTTKDKEMFLEYSEQYNKIKEILKEGVNCSEKSRKENRIR